MDNIEQDILKYLQKYSGSNNVTLETTVNNDLKYHGLDAEELLSFIEKKYHVDFSILKFEEYFFEEMGFLDGLKYKFLKKKDKKKKPLTVNHLVNVIEKGKWFDPDVDDKND